MLKNNDYKFFNKAKTISTLSDYEKIHIGCVAVYKGQIIGVGYNCNKTHPMQKYYNTEYSLTICCQNFMLKLVV